MCIKFITKISKNDLKYFNNKNIKKEKIKEENFSNDIDEIIIEDILPLSKNKKSNKKK